MPLFDYSLLLTGKYHDMLVAGLLLSLQLLAAALVLALPIALVVALLRLSPFAPLLGASRPDQLDATLAAAEYKLDPALKQKLDELTAEYRKGDAPR